MTEKADMLKVHVGAGARGESRTLLKTTSGPRGACAAPRAYRRISRLSAYSGRSGRSDKRAPWPAQARWPQGWCRGHYGWLPTSSARCNSPVS
jgi:hypothetical protein